jgi:hypothetical protein
MEKTPSLKPMLVVEEVMEEEALPKSTPDFKAKKESSMEFLGVAIKQFRARLYWRINGRACKQGLP